MRRGFTIGAIAGYIVGFLIRLVINGVKKFIGILSNDLGTKKD